MADPVLPKVGVKNPFVVAELKQGKRINWSKKTPEEIARVLENAFGRPYDQLFDPKYGSPLFPQKSTSGVLLPSTGAGDPVSCSPNPCPQFNDFLPLPGASPFVSLGRYEDPIQGCLPDCYLVSALCSYAWAIKSAQIFKENIEPNPYSYTFYTPEVDASGALVIGGRTIASQAFTINEKIPLILPETIVYTRSNDYKEIWPCLYEKAYATWVYSRKNNIAPGPTVRPDYLTICQGNPVTALIHLTGKQCNAYNTNSLADGDSYLKIRSQFTAAGSIKTHYPTVAWTYGTAPAGVSYSNDVIVANHSYSVLGVYPQAIPADLNQGYIVMRNPFGQSRGDPKENIDPNLPSDAFYKGSWGPLNRSLGITTDGIFALKDSVFRKYFAGFGWVKF